MVSYDISFSLSPSLYPPLSLFLSLSLYPSLSLSVSLPLSLLIWVSVRIYLSGPLNFQLLSEFLREQEYLYFASSENLSEVLVLDNFLCIILYFKVKVMAG